MEDWQYESAHDQGMSATERWRSVKREAGLGESIMRLGWRASIKTYLTCWHRLSVTGKEHLPVEPPFVMIANHSSHLDAVAMASVMPARLRDCVFPVAAGDHFFETPGLSAFAASLMNALPIWRHQCGRHALKDLRDRLLEEPCGFILFPEGTRSRTGEMGTFKSGLGMLIAQSNVPVVPCHLAGAHKAWPPGCRLPRPRKIRLTIGEPITFADQPNRRAGWNVVAEQTRQAVCDLAEV